VGEGAKPRLPLAEIAITLAGIALIAGLVVAVPALREAFSSALRGDHEAVRTEIDSLGVWGPVLIVALALIHAVVFYPAEIVDAAAGYAYGFGPALALTMTGWVLSGLLCFAVGRSVARPLLEPLARRAAVRADRGGNRARRRRPADRDAADPDPAVQHRLLRGRRRPGPDLALRMDHRHRLYPNHRDVRLPRDQTGEHLGDRPAGPRRRRRPPAPACRRPLGTAPPAPPRPSLKPIARFLSDASRPKGTAQRFSFGAARARALEHEFLLRCPR